MCLFFIWFILLGTIMLSLKVTTNLSRVSLSLLIVFLTENNHFSSLKLFKNMNMNNIEVVIFILFDIVVIAFNFMSIITSIVSFCSIKYDDSISLNINARLYIYYFCFCLKSERMFCLSVWRKVETKMIKENVYFYKI